MKRLSIIHKPSATPYLCAILVVPIEVFDSSGVAHVLEHLVFHSGESQVAGLTDLVNVATTVYLDAVTSRRYTAYRLAATTELALEALLMRLLDSAWSPDLSEPAFSEQAWRIESCGNKLRYNGVVYNETLTAYRDPNRRAWESICSLLHQGELGQFDAGGMPDSIVRLQIRDVRAAHTEWYRPERCFLLLTGPIEQDRLSRQLSKVKRPDKSANSAKSDRPLFAEPVRASESESSQIVWPLAGWRLGLVSDQLDLAEAELLNLVLLDRITSALPAVLSRASAGAPLWSQTGLHTTCREIAWVVGSEIPDTRSSSPFDCKELVTLVRRSAEVLGQVHSQNGGLSQILDHWRLSRELTAQFASLPDGLAFLSAIIPNVLDGICPSKPLLNCEAIHQDLQGRIRSDPCYLQNLLARFLVDNDRFVAIDYAHGSRLAEPLPSGRGKVCSTPEKGLRKYPLLIPPHAGGRARRPTTVINMIYPGLWQGSLPNSPLTALRLALDRRITLEQDCDAGCALAAYTAAGYVGQQLCVATRALQQHGPRVQLSVREHADRFVIEPLISFECLGKHFEGMLEIVRAFFERESPKPASPQIAALLIRRLPAALALLRQRSHQQAIVTAAAPFSRRCAWSHSTTGLGMILTATSLPRGTLKQASIYKAFTETVDMCDRATSSRAAALLLAPNKDLRKSAATLARGLPLELGVPGMHRRTEHPAVPTPRKQALLIPSAVASFARAYPVSVATPPEQAGLSIIAGLLDRAVRRRARTERGAYLAGAVYDPRVSLFGLFVSRHVVADKALSDFDAAVEEVGKGIEKLCPQDVPRLGGEPRIPPTHPFTALGRCETIFFDSISNDNASRAAVARHSSRDTKGILQDCMQRFLLSSSPSDVVVGASEVIIPLLTAEWSVLEPVSLNLVTRCQQRGYGH